LPNHPAFDFSLDCRISIKRAFDGRETLASRMQSAQATSIGQCGDVRIAAGGRTVCAGTRPYGACPEPVPARAMTPSNELTSRAFYPTILWYGERLHAINFVLSNWYKCMLAIW